MKNYSDRFYFCAVYSFSSPPNIGYPIAPVRFQSCGDGRRTWGLFFLTVCSLNFVSPHFWILFVPPSMHRIRHSVINELPRRKQRGIKEFKFCHSALDAESRK
jgi:hypothetical protein